MSCKFVIMKSPGLETLWESTFWSYWKILIHNLVARCYCSNWIFIRSFDTIQYWHSISRCGIGHIKGSDIPSAHLSHKIWYISNDHCEYWGLRRNSEKYSIFDLLIVKVHFYLQKRQVFFSIFFIFRNQKNMIDIWPLAKKN